MEKFNELLEKLNGLKLIQKQMDWAECLPEEIWNEHFKDNFKKLKSGLNPDAYRWYETSISVISIYDKLLGIKHITNLFSESSSCEDCYVKIEFFEMKEVTVISYNRV
jgi:hypothetical protein